MFNGPLRFTGQWIKCNEISLRCWLLVGVLLSQRKTILQVNAQIKSTGISLENPSRLVLRINGKLVSGILVL